MDPIIRLMNVLATFALLLIPAFIISCAGASDQRITSPPGTTTTYILVRHAEKKNNDVARPLTDKGRKRAQALIDAVEPLCVTAIYCTRTKRNMETVQPLSDHLGIAVQTLYKGGPMNAATWRTNSSRTVWPDIVAVSSSGLAIPHPGGTGRIIFSRSICA